MTEKMIEIDGIELATESFGDASDPPLLLIMGMGASMVWWEDDLCRSLAGGGRFVIRYDHRDTGRSTSYEPGDPGYGAGDLVADAAAVLDGYRLPAAHVIGLSMGGALAQLLTLEFPGRVSSLTLISTSFAVSSDRDLPPAAGSYVQFLRDAQVDWDDAQSVIDYVVDHWRALNGTTHPFDEPRVRRLAARDVQRARNFSSAQNHGLLTDEAPPAQPVSAIAVPTLVIHGSADPFLPLEHGQALSREIPDATLLTLEGSGHGLQPPDWDAARSAILTHTGRKPA